MMGKKTRVYLSVYFSDTGETGRKRGDVTLAFRPDDPLYFACKELGSTGMKKLLGVGSYADAVEHATKDGRPVGNYLKHRLRVALGL